MWQAPAYKIIQIKQIPVTAITEKIDKYRYLQYYLILCGYRVAMKTCLVFAILVIGVCHGTSTRLLSTDQIEELFKKATTNQLTEEDNAALQDLVEILKRPEHASARAEFSTELRNTLDCIVCRSAFTAFFESVHNGQSDEQLASTITFFCVILNIENHEVCQGAISTNMPILHHIVETTPEAAPATFCGLVLQGAQDPNICPFNDPRFEWTVDLPEPLESLPEPITSEDALTIAILTDTHIDPLYEAYGVANCDAPTCCRVGQSPAPSFRYKNQSTEHIAQKSVVRTANGIMIDLDVAPQLREARSLLHPKVETRNDAPAGFWGDYRDCDTPLWAYDDVIERMSEAHPNIDVIYYIGDTIDHGVWETSYDLINDMNKYIVDKIREHFGDDVLVVPVIGNHESQPTNQFAPPDITEEYLNTTWLYEALADKWGLYLDDTAKATLRDRGDFSVSVRPGLRAISLNNNVAYKFNWWLVYNPLDAKRHLDWLVEELSAAEQAGDKVHILAHIPPGVHDLTLTWTREYNRIVNRFSSTIAAEFNGHTHSDEFKVFFDENDAPINVAWGGGSATTYSHYNLNYKLAAIDTQTYMPKNIVNYVYNLTEANLTPNQRPHWFLLYDMANSFGLPDLSAQSMGDLVTRMVTTERHLLDMYSAFYSKISDNRIAWCDTNCKLNNLCKTVVTVLWERQRCTDLVNAYYSR